MSGLAKRRVLISGLPRALATLWILALVVPSPGFAEAPPASPAREDIAEISELEASGEIEAITSLRRLYAADENFRADLDAAFQNLHPLPGGAPNPWQGKDFEDLCQFLDEWYRFVPRPGEGLSYIIEFLWLYYENAPALRLVREEPGRSWTRQFVLEKARYMDSAESLSTLEAWLQDPGVEIDDFVVPAGGFASFNDFFTRRLEPGARPVTSPANDRVLVSPADCSIRLDPEPLGPETKITLKGPFQVEIVDLLEGSDLAERFFGGSTLFCILQPTSYHHFHAPVSGQVVEAREDVAGIYMGIAAMREVPDPPTVHHGYLLIETEHHGHVGMVTVGLQTISSIRYRDDLRRVNRDDPPVAILKGERVGNFAYGGSLVVLFFEPGKLGELSVRQGAQLGILQ